MPFGYSLKNKNMFWNRRFGKTGYQLDPLFSQLQFAFSIGEQLLSSYNGNLIEVLEDDGATTQEFGIVDGVLDTASLLSFVGVNNGYVVGVYDQKTGVKTAISTSAQQILIVNAGVLVSYTAKYLLEIPQNTALTVSGIASCNRMKNLSMINYISFKGAKAITGYSQDYIFPVNCSAGLMDFGWTNLSNIFWYLVGGTTSTNARPGATLDAGVNYSFGTNMSDNGIGLNAYGTGVRFIGSLKDLPKLTYFLSLTDCSLTTGSLTDLQGKITYLLSLANCNLMTGSLADLQGKITTFLSLVNCNLMTGSLADLQGKIQLYLELTNCTLVTGVYTPIDATATPTTFDISGTGLTESNVDNTLIACDTIPRSSVTFTWTGLTRTAASDTAAYSLKNEHAWTFSPALP